MFGILLKDSYTYVEVYFIFVSIIHFWCESILWKCCLIFVEGSLLNKHTENLKMKIFVIEYTQKHSIFNNWFTSCFWTIKQRWNLKNWIYSNVSVTFKLPFTKINYNKDTKTGLEQKSSKKNKAKLAHTLPADNIPLNIIEKTKYRIWRGNKQIIRGKANIRK